MVKVIGTRDSGKAYKLLEAANKAYGTVITANKQALATKADNYGFYNVKIIDYNDLLAGNYYLGENTFIHNADKFLTFILNDKFGLFCSGLSITEE